MIILKNVIITIKQTYHKRVLRKLKTTVKIIFLVKMTTVKAVNAVIH